MSDRQIAKAGRALIEFLDQNLGYGPDWPVNMRCDEDVSDELFTRLNALRDACGITLQSHAELYRRPPDPCSTRNFIRPKRKK